MSNRVQRCQCLRTIGVAALLAAGLNSLAAGADVCPEAGAKARKEQVLIPGYQSGRKIIGTGRAYFYAQPAESCREKDVFVIPGEPLNAYMTYKDFTYVMYIHPRTGADTSGWIKTNRLESTGTGIAPRPNEKP